MIHVPIYLKPLRELQVEHEATIKWCPTVAAFSFNLTADLGD
jgi:hypothetical protein